MRISRIYTDHPLASGNTVTLDGPAAHYLSKVLRLKANMKLIVFNGDGFDYPGTIQHVGKHSLDLKILDRQRNMHESPLHTCLGLGLSRGERMDFAIQKSTELGVNEIVPLACEFSELKLKGERLQKKLQHWRQIVISACEQCGRATLPEVKEPLSLATWAAALECQAKLIFDPLPGEKPEFGLDVKSAALAIGPEGGFSEAELAVAKKNGFQALTLGPRILRTETAPVAALASLQMLWGDFSL